MRKLAAIALIVVHLLAALGRREDVCSEEMVAYLKNLQATYTRFDNYYASEAHVHYYDSLITHSNSAQDIMFFTMSKARALIALGKEDEAVAILEPQVQKINDENIQGMDRMKAML